jgi:hypothetical protein
MVSNSTPTSEASTMDSGPASPGSLRMDREQGENNDRGETTDNEREEETTDNDDRNLSEMDEELSAVTETNDDPEDTDNHPLKSKLLDLRGDYVCRKDDQHRRTQTIRSVWHAQLPCEEPHECDKATFSCFLFPNSRQERIQSARSIGPPLLLRA